MNKTSTENSLHVSSHQMSLFDRRQDQPVCVAIHLSVLLYIHRLPLADRVQQIHVFQIWVCTNYAPLDVDILHILQRLGLQIATTIAIKFSNWLLLAKLWVTYLYNISPSIINPTFHMLKVLSKQNQLTLDLPICFGMMVWTCFQAFTSQ